jgi:transcriptional regulator with XRE-family HTH domain
MKERIMEFLRKENKTSAQFADDIGVQPSAISHIISGRNNPSLDFIIKMLEKYSFLSTEWLLFGKGSMYKESRMADLFEGAGYIENKTADKSEGIIQKQLVSDEKQSKDEGIKALHISDKVDTEVIKIVWFYENNSFEEFYPRKE